MIINTANDILKHFCLGPVDSLGILYIGLAPF